MAQEPKERPDKAAETRAKNASEQRSNKDVSSYDQGALIQDEDASAASSFSQADRMWMRRRRFRSVNSLKVASISALESCGRQQISQ